MPPHVVTPILPPTEDLQRHEVLSQQHGDKETVLLTYNGPSRSPFGVEHETVETIFPANHLERVSVVVK